MATTATNWTCPHCDRPQTLTEKQVFNGELPSIYKAVSKHGHFAVAVLGITCANPECQELTVDVALVHGTTAANGTKFWRKGSLSEHRLRPRSSARQWPEYIPEQIRQDYEEACLILELSGKAAATLCRRCLQGMIRDFTGVARATLDQEIKALKEAVDGGRAPKGVEAETMDAIDAVRKIGNIGAHMEKDVDVIVPVDPDEARTLIQLIEMLLAEWYVARHSREKKLADLKKLADQKQAQRKAPAVTAAVTAAAPPKAAATTGSGGSAGGGS